MPLFDLESGRRRFGSLREQCPEERDQLNALDAIVADGDYGYTIAWGFQGAEQAGLKTKTWQTNSANPREAHAALDGETVALDERFSNGQLWPGDPAGGAQNNANCKCSVTFGRE